MPEPIREPAPGLSPEMLALQKLAKGARFDEIESAWMAAVEGGALSVDDFIRVLVNLDKGADAKRKDQLVWFMLTLWAEKRGPAEGLTAAQLAADLFPQSPLLRDELCSLYRKVHAASPGIEALTDMTVRRKEVALPTSVEQIDRLLELAPGTFVMDDRRRAPGKVIGVDAAKKVLVVAFEDRERTFDPQMIDHLQTLDPTDFRALAAFGQEHLRALAKDDPAEVVRLVLKVRGPQLTYKEMKAEIEPAVPAESWSRWWAAAKLAVRQSPALELSEGPQPTFTLRMKPLSYEEAVRGRFDVAKGEARLLTALGYLAETAGTDHADAGVLRYFATSLAVEVEKAGEKHPASSIAHLAVLGEIRRRAPDTAPHVPITLQQLLGHVPDLAAVLRHVESPDLAIAILAMIRDEMPDKWPEVYAGTFPGCTVDICDWMAGALSEAGHTPAVAAAVATALRKPERHVAALVWLWRAATAERYPEVIGGVDLVALAIGVLRSATHLARQGTPEAKELLAQVRSALSNKDFAMLRKVIPMAESDRAKDLRHIVDRNAGLSDLARVQVLEIVHSAHTALFAKPIVPPWLDPDVIFSSDVALKRHRKEFENLANVKMVENAKAIGAAAEHGDLTENSEFIAAMEERDRLAGKAGQMRDELARARAITAIMAGSESVCIGSAVTAKDVASGETRRFVFLGPWDANLEKNIYSYRAALSQAFMAKRVGDVVTLPGEGGDVQWEIFTVESGLGDVTENA